ncbi:MFS transporter [Actinomadura madurae]|uniref:MFS transporter n=1 Tax=Actinomadura madurae TaxID=1993 RepID=UPI0020D2395C|nr:MFS transporter [Actinomadura madurae]
MALGIVTAAGASAAVVSAPLVGVLSDRTRWRFGRRRSWIIGGSAVCAVALLALPLQSSLLGVGLCWALVHGGTGGVHAVVCAVVADRVAVNRRGTVFAVVDLAQPVGLVAGTLLVSSLSIEDAYPLVAGLAVLLAVPYALIGRDVPAPGAGRAAATVASRSGLPGARVRLGVGRALRGTARDVAGHRLSALLSPGRDPDR